jgi:hypothetical protein
VLGDDAGKAVRHGRQRLVPRRALSRDHRVQEPALEPDRLAERRAFRAQPTEIGRVVGIARDRDAAEPVGRGADAAADAAIGAGRAHGSDFGRCDDARFGHVDRHQ